MIDIAGVLEEGGTVAGFDAERYAHALYWVAGLLVPPSAEQARAFALLWASGESYATLEGSYAHWLQVTR